LKYPLWRDPLFYLELFAKVLIILLMMFWLHVFIKAVGGVPASEVWEKEEHE